MSRTGRERTESFAGFGRSLSIAHPRRVPGTFGLGKRSLASRSLLALALLTGASFAQDSETEEDSGPPPPVPPPVGSEEQPAEQPTGAPPAGESKVEASTSLSGTGRGQSVRMHATLVGAKAIAGYQREEFGFGGGALVALEWGPTPVWGLMAEAGFVGLLGVKKPPPEGLAELGGAAGGHIAGGVRVRPLAESKVVDYPAGPWLSGAVGASLTGGEIAPLLDAFVGYDFALHSNLSLGPTAGYLLVLQTRETPRPDNAHLVLLGIHGSFDFGSAAPVVKDRDFDGILDKQDACPERPEDKDGFEDTDGCPDLDNDEDGIRDEDDRCPLDAEDLDKFEDEDGCPDPDNDLDRVLDPVDKCPIAAEDLDSYLDDDGCAELDNDLDEILDLKDLCPNEPETRNGISDNDGCPDEESVRVVGDKIELDQKIHFWTNSSRIRGMSYPVLEKLAKFLILHPEYVHIDVEGHADARGDETYNLDLSKGRAHSVKEFLIKSGVEKDRVASEGFGSSRPLVEGKSEHAWFMNRRVEFIVTRNQSIKIDPTTGAPVKLAPRGEFTPTGEAPVDEGPAPEAEVPDVAPTNGPKKEEASP